MVENIDWLYLGLLIWGFIVALLPILFIQWYFVFNNWKSRLYTTLGIIVIEFAGWLSLTVIFDSF